MIQINKELQRPDGGNVKAGSIVDYNARFLSDVTTIVYDLKLYFNQKAIDEKKLPVPKVDNLKFRITKKCTEEQWKKLNESGSVDLVQSWLKELIDQEIGKGFTEIV